MRANVEGCAITPVVPAKACTEASESERWPVACLLLICLLALACAFSIKPSSSMDDDVWWHMHTGNWILRHRVVPTHDVFGLYTAGKAWIAYTWLFDVLTAWIYSAWGLQGLLALTASLTLAFIAGMVFLLSRYTRMVRAIALSALVGFAIIPLIEPRPWLFTCLFFVVALYFLMLARDSGRALWLLPVVPLFALWANIHIQFVYGLGTIGLFALERPLASQLKWKCDARLESRWFWSVLGASLFATLLNPYGWRLYLVAARYAMERVPMQAIQEMQAMSFRDVSDWATLFLVCSALFVTASASRKCALMISLIVVSLWFGFRSARDVWFLAAVSALASAYSSRGAEGGLACIRWKQWAIATPLALAAGLAVFRSNGVSEAALHDYAAKHFPVGASAYVERHGLHNPLYNPYGWGGYLMWRLPQMPVSIDGRADLQGDARLTRYLASWRGKRDWASDAALMKANTIILERDSALASILCADPRFRMVYDDDVASVFEPARSLTERAGRPANAHIHWGRPR